MLRINMLPPGCRQAEGIPVPVILMSVTALGLGVICVAAFLWLTVQARTINNKRAVFENMQHRITELAEERNSLDETIGTMRTRRDMILDVRRKRILWAKKLDRLARKTPKDIIWWESARMRQTDAAKATESGSLSVDCLQADPEIERMDMYRESIRSDRMFWRDFASMNLPGCRRDENDILHYTLTFHLKPRVLPVAAAPQPGTGKGGRR